MRSKVELAGIWLIISISYYVKVLFSKIILTEKKYSQVCQTICFIHYSKGIKLKDTIYILTEGDGYYYMVKSA